MKNFKIAAVFITFFGAVAMLCSAFFNWVIWVDPLAIQEEVVDPWNFLIKKISVGILGAGGIFVTYYYSRTKFPKKSSERKFILLQLMLGAVALFIVVTGRVPETYEATISNGTGFIMALGGSILNLIGSIILYFIIKKQESTKK